MQRPCPICGSGDVFTEDCIKIGESIPGSHHDCVFEFKAHRDCCKRVIEQGGDLGAHGPEGIAIRGQ